MGAPKIGICVGNVFKLPPGDVIPLIADTGFDAVSPVWSSGGTLKKTVQLAGSCGLVVQSVHGPQKKASAMWSRDPVLAGEALAEFTGTLRDCAALGVPITVFHCVSGFDLSGICLEAGLRNFSVLAEEAETLGVQIAFENIQGEQYLRALMAHFKDVPHVGFCWDSGHELCYSPTRSLLAEFGSRLVMTHLNSNLGITSPDGTISARDDLHYLPFDGHVPWEKNIHLLRASRKQDILTFEVKQLAKAYQPQNETYAQMSCLEYLIETRRQAGKIADMYISGRN